MNNNKNIINKLEFIFTENGFRCTKEATIDDMINIVLSGMLAVAKQNDIDLMYTKFAQAMSTFLCTLNPDMYLSANEEDLEADAQKMSELAEKYGVNIDFEAIKEAVSERFEDKLAEGETFEPDKIVIPVNEVEDEQE